MKSVEFLSESLQKITIILEEYQAQFQGMAIDINTTKNTKNDFPSFRFNESFLKEQQEKPHPTNNSRQPKVTYTNQEIADKPPDFLDNLLISYSHNTKKPLGDSFLRKMRKILVDIPKREIGIKIQRLINEGKIIDFSAELEAASKANLNNSNANEH